MANPEFHLRPDMRVDVEMLMPAPSGVSIPTAAVVNSGRAKWVFVEAGEDNFTIREIRTGTTFGDRVEVTSGLQKGEVIVSSGTFLIDSESRMREAGHSQLAASSALLH